MADMLRKTHSLVVGGTGMLRGVVGALANEGAEVTVIARRRPGLEQLERAHGGRVTGIALDYRTSDELAAALGSACAARGPFALAVAWLHDDAPEAIRVIAGHMARSNSPCRLLHVLSSAHADPGRSRARAVAPTPGTGLVYQEVVLGFRYDRSGSRWLSHAEIVDGVLDAVRGGQPRSIVGTVTPWSARP